MKPIVKMIFGSHLYGSSTTASDHDFKGVHLPGAREMLLHQTQGSFSERTKEDRTAKNTADDVDVESFALHKWFGMLAKGDANALEMLLAPPSAILHQTDEWAAIQERRDKFVSLRFAQGFVDYMRRQAAKYGIKGSRVGSVRSALALIDDWIATYGKDRKVAFFQDAIELFSEVVQHSRIISIQHPNGPEQLHWEVVGRKFPLGVHIGEVRRVLQSVFENYGARTRAAEQGDGVDWKAMSHAIRVGGQALELLREGTLTFPRPDAPRLLAIKQGAVDYKAAEVELEALIEEVKAEAARSTIRPEFDWDAANQLTLYFYGEQVVNAPPEEIGWQRFDPDVHDLLGFGGRFRMTGVSVPALG